MGEGCRGPPIAAHVNSRCYPTHLPLPSSPISTLREGADKQIYLESGETSSEKGVTSQNHAANRWSRWGAPPLALSAGLQFPGRGVHVPVWRDKTGSCDSPPPAYPLNHFIKGQVVSNFRALGYALASQVSWAYFPSPVQAPTGPCPHCYLSSGGPSPRWPQGSRLLVFTPSVAPPTLSLCFQQNMTK